MIIEVKAASGHCMLKIFVITKAVVYGLEPGYQKDFLVLFTGHFEFLILTVSPPSSCFSFAFLLGKSKPATFGFLAPIFSL